MKKKEKRMILILVVVSIIIISVIFFATRNKNKNNNNVDTTNSNAQVKEEYVQVQDDGSKLNISSKLNETKKVDGLEIGNIRFTESNGISTLLADVKNTKSSAIEMTSIMITLLDKDGKNIVEFEGLIAPIGPGESTQLNAGITSDYANAYDFSVKVIK